MSKKAIQALVIIFILFGVLLFSPVITIFNKVNFVFGVPAVVFYIFSSWLLIILFILIIVEVNALNKND